MFTLLIAAALAHADGIHAGVPVTGIDGFGAPSFQTTQTGWSAVVLDGFVRVFVGKTEADAEAWLMRIKKTLRKEKPKPNPKAFSAEGITDVHGDGTRLILFRDGNIGICVQHKTNARPWAKKVHQAIEDDGPPWPEPPRLTPFDGAWRIEVPSGAAQVAYEGGTRIPGQGLNFSVAPTAVIVWDGLGRSARAETAQEPAAP